MTALARTLLALLLLTSGASVGASAAHAQSYPSRPTHLVVGFPIGGPADLVARVAAQHLTERFGQPVVVDNHPGATGTIAAEQVARAAPDGYTMFMATQPTNAVAPYMYAKVGYDPLKDFATVVRVGHSPLLIAVHPAMPVRSIGDLIAAAKARPGQINFATGGVGSTPHVSMELFQRTLKLDMVAVHYKGESAAVVEAVGGHVQALAASISVLLPYVRSGKLRGLAITTRERSTLAPEFPTIAESGLRGFDTSSWFGIVVPAKTPAEIIRRLNTEIVQWLSQPGAREQFVKMGVEIVADTPEQFAAFLREENVRWGKLVRELHLRAE
jgi:tripartite-type tricarboxylate transporter receptor subunit TctC